MLLMALQTWEIFNFIPSTNALSKNKKRGFAGAFLAGILGGLFASPCSTPVLVVLLAFVAKEGKILLGIVLLLLYSLGNSSLVLVAGTSVGFVKKLSSSEGYGKVSLALRIIMGAVIALIGLYMFYLAF
jgi:cytochrome c biogenesis protein CcdA